MNTRKVPWPKLREYLLRVSSCPTRGEFMRTACVEAQALIPFDAGAGVFAATDARHLIGIGQGDSVNTAYNDYYRTRWNPYFLDKDGRCQGSAYSPPPGSGRFPTLA